nr:serine/threonine-protein kinase grp [Ipomoea batatas]
MLLSDWNVRRSCESENTSRNRQRSVHHTESSPILQENMESDGIIMAENIELSDVIKDTMQYRFQREVLIKFRKEEIADDRKAQMKKFAAIRTKINFGLIKSSTVFLEYLGGTMEELLDNLSPNFEAAMKYCIQISSGLQFLHEHGIVHQYLNPSN